MRVARWESCRAVAGLLALLAVGCGPVNTYAPPPPPEVMVAHPVKEEIRDFLDFTGSTRAVDMVSLRARVNGYLKSVEFEDGATVKEGDLLFVIEPAPYEAALLSAKANLQRAEAALKLAKAEITRTIPLVTRGALPEQELDLKEANQATAEADVAAAAAALTQAELNLSYTKISAPIDGRIGRHMVDVGNLVQAEQTALTTLESYDPIFVYFYVSESDVLRLMDMQPPGDAKTDFADGPRIAMGLSSDQGYPHEGVLDFSDLGIDPNTGTQLRRGLFKNQDRRLVPGLFVRVRLPIGTPADALLISERAIATDQRGDYVLVVDDKNVVEYRPVKLGIAIDGRRVVHDGVTADDWVVVNGLQRARPGAPVNPQRPKDEAPSAEAQAHNSADAPHAGD